MKRGNSIYNNIGSLNDFWAFTDLMPCGIAMYEYRYGKLSIIYYNDRLCEIIGYSRNEYWIMARDNPWVFVFEEDLVTLQQKFNDLVLTGKQIDCEYRVYNRTAISWVHLTATVVGSYDDSVLINAVIVDISNPSDDKPVSPVMSLYDAPERERKNIQFSGHNEMKQVFEIMVENSRQYILIYRFNTDILETYTHGSKPLFYKVQGPYTPSVFFASGFIAPESLDELRSFYYKLRSGVPNGSITFKGNDGYGQWQWYNCKYTTIFNDKGQPNYSVIICENITDIRHKDIVLKRFRDFTAVKSHGISFNMEYNLSLDRFEGKYGYFPNEYTLNPEDTFTKAIQLLGQNIHIEDRKDFFEFFSRYRLLNSHAKGVNLESKDFRALLNGKYRWTRITCHTLEDPYSTNVILWISWTDIDERKQLEQRLISNAQIDKVTGIYNRATFEEKVQERIKSFNKKLMDAFVMLDLDCFTRINDTFGHAYGDKMLRYVSKTIGLVLSQDDIFGRVGGDEFALYISGISDLETIEEKLRIINAAVFRELKYSIQLSASIGVALRPRDGNDFDELYKRADIAMYHAKETGRNKFVFFTDNLPKIRNNIISPVAAISMQDKRVYIRTFGYFDIFVDGEAILIQHAKAKELLALLVDRRGGFVTAREIISYLWESENANKVTLSRCRKTFMRLRETLKDYGIEDILESNNGSRRIRTEKVDCDLYNYLSGAKEYSHLYKGSYMLNYSWGEFTISELESGFNA